MTAEAAEAAEPVTLVSADRALRARVEQLGAGLAAPRWLLQVLDEGGDAGAP